jgi:hypothetical protein
LLSYFGLEDRIRYLAGHLQPFRSIVLMLKMAWDKPLPGSGFKTFGRQFLSAFGAGNAARGYGNCRIVQGAPIMRVMVHLNWSDMGLPDCGLIWFFKETNDDEDYAIQHDRVSGFSFGC